MDWLPPEAAFVIGGIVVATILYLVFSERRDRHRNRPPDENGND